MLVQEQHPALLVLQALELRNHQVVHLPGREHGGLDDAGGFLQETAAQLECRQYARRLARTDAGQGQHPVLREIEQRAQVSVCKIQQLTRQVERAATAVAAAQQDGEQLAVAEAPRSAGEHLFARPFIRAEVLDTHNGARIRP